MSPKGPRTYEEARQTFAQFVTAMFPVGSDAKDAISRMTNAGFRTEGATALNKAELVWSRNAGPCLERYFVVVGQSADGKIADIAGQLYPACL
ncbi:hypothetical protein JQ633_24150 [Bradyrhizobium tropiciagri]|nr:hypothetical protein [Bradyrhizobium tropiciagri]